MAYVTRILNNLATMYNQFAVAALKYS